MLPDMATHCSHCGAERTGTAKCVQCGAPVEAPPGGWPPPSTSGLPPTFVDTSEHALVPSQVKRRDRRLTVGLITTIALAALGTLWFTLSNKPPQPEDPSAGLSATQRAGQAIVRNRQATQRAGQAPEAEQAPEGAADPAPSRGVTQAALAQAARAKAGTAPSPGGTDAWPAHFEELPLWQAFERALPLLETQAALESADCARRPCIIYGRGADQQALVALLSREPLDTYREARRLIYDWPAAQGVSPHFAIAFMPHDLPAQTLTDLTRSVEDRVKSRRGLPEAP